MNLKTNSRKLFLYKIISLLCLFLIFIPSDKFSLPYIVFVLALLIGNISNLIFSSDVFFSLISIIGFIMIFIKKKYVTLAGYLLASLNFSILIYHVDFNKLDFWFWIPLLLFIVTSVYVIVLKFNNT